ncbi:MAG: hypothetical protein KatS3mg129_0244 [Leptospiraceae bacterium]|nr:MAG: hypothetical protein KatS3mg129_0244 [Leptospiraceae bacterium]
MNKKFDLYGEIASYGFGEGKAIILYPYNYYIPNNKT